MPTVLRHGPYRLFFYSHEPNEPPHVHVRRERFEAKFWLSPSVSLAKNWGFAGHELNSIERVIRANQQGLIDAWNHYFPPQP